MAFKHEQAGNSDKDYRKQGLVIESLCEQITSGQPAIRGIMMESTTVFGRSSDSRVRRA